MSSLSIQLHRVQISAKWFICDPTWPRWQMNCERTQRSPVATKKHKHNTSARFGQKKLELLPESWKLNGNIFIELSFRGLDEIMTSTSYKREQNKKQNKQRNKPIIYSPRGVRHENENKACFWIISALEASKWFQITYFNLTNVLTSISESSGPNFGQIKHFSAKSAITLGFAY